MNTNLGVTCVATNLEKNHANKKFLSENSRFDELPYSDAGGLLNLMLFNGLSRKDAVKIANERAEKCASGH